MVMPLFWGYFFLITDTSVCSYIHLLIDPSSTSRQNILWIECTKKFKNIQSMFTYMYSTYHVVSFFLNLLGGCCHIVINFLVRIYIHPIYKMTVPFISYLIISNFQASSQNPKSFTVRNFLT